MKKERERFVREVLEGAESKASLCRKYGISRPTGDKWLHRFQEGGNLSSLSSSGHRTPLRTPPDVEQRIIALRLRYPGIGAKKLKRILENQGHTIPCASTVNNILHRHGCITPEASAAAQHIIRFQMEHPNDMWQTDFKGHFALGNGTRCHPLNIVDDHSRFCLRSDAKGSEQFLPTKESFTSAFREFGLPDRLLCDNGNPWGTSQSVGYTAFEVWLMELGVLTVHGRIRHPQTQGKQERFNGSQTRELLRFSSFADMAEAQRGLDEYRRFYNSERPHEALNMETPDSVYSPSTRRMPDSVEDWDYPEGEVMQVKSQGYLAFQEQRYYLGEALSEKTVAILPGAEDAEFQVLFRNFQVAVLDIQHCCVVLRKPKMCK